MYRLDAACDVFRDAGAKVGVWSKGVCATMLPRIVSCTVGPRVTVPQCDGAFWPIGFISVCCILAKLGKRTFRENHARVLCPV